jgi:hypothetical protein
MKRCFLLFFFVFPLFSYSQIEMLPGNDGILFTENGKEVLYYQIEPKSADGKYSRCNYFHPIWGLNGEILSEDFPVDHLHHRGLFWAWHQVLVNGNSVGNLWELNGIEQEIAEIEFAAQPSGSGLFKTEVFWKSAQSLNHGIIGPIIKEKTSVTLHPLRGNSRRIDFEISLLALKENVQLGGSNDEKGYGGFSLRMKLPSDVVFTGAKGIVEPNVNQVESPGWINISGSSTDFSSRFGIAILDHQSNAGYPQPWILRKERSMQNIVFPGRTPFNIPTEKPLVLRYSLLVHNGNLKPRAINRLTKNNRK